MLKFVIFTVIISFANCDMNMFESLFGSNSNGKGDSRVVGGEDARTRVPYQLSLQMYKPKENGGSFMDMFQTQPSSNYSHFCGASVVNENYFVTAAHCIEGFNQSRMSVLAGVNDLREENKGSRHFVESCLIHPEYVMLNNSDVAVCRVENQFELGDNVAPIKLSDEHVGGQVECTLTGWGYTSFFRGTPLPNKLQTAQLPTITNEECNQKGHNVGPREICTLSRFGKGACGGDSGGPLAKDGVLVGIVSYGTRICAINVPDVYTRASPYVDWIEQNTVA